MLKLMLGVGTSFACRSTLAQVTRTQFERTIPSSGETIPVIGLGTSQTFDVGPAAADRSKVKEVLRLFVEYGGTMIDTSPMYGRAERVVGDLSEELGNQDDLFLATKVWTRGRNEGIQQMEESMRLLKTNQIDLMQVHNLVDTQTHLKTLQDWKAQKRVRYVGITHYRVDAFDALEKVIKQNKLDYVQLNYSIVTREAEQRLLPLCADRGVAVLVNRPFEDGDLFRLMRGEQLPAWASEFDCQSWAQFFLKFILSHPAVTNVIPATSKPKHLADNMQAGFGRLPDARMREKMAKFML
jgi:diketogulonate reductase-like aldo/keto reductase